MNLKTFKVQILLFTIIGLGFSSLIYFTGHFSIETQDLEFYPSQPDDWEEKDKSIELHGRF